VNTTPPEDIPTYDKLYAILNDAIMEAGKLSQSYYETHLVEHLKYAKGVIVQAKANRKTD
jgi:hypothetical protein